LTANSPSQYTILAVDDEPDILRLVERVLTRQGYTVIGSGGADSALAALARMRRKPDLLLTDVVMPGTSGPMLVDRILAIQPDIKVLFMSGYDERQVVQRYVVERGFALLTKPFSPQDLATSVKETLESRVSAGEPES
jgi:two-component system cell cycle sensor histidine kinase/response regulator CckA